MQKKIVQSKNEPDKNNLWLSEEGLKKYGNNGWEIIGGGVTDTTPITDSLNGDELIPVRQNGENKAVSADTLIKGGKEIYNLTLYSDKIDYNKLKEAIESGKMVTLLGKPLQCYIQSNSILLISSTVSDDANENILIGATKLLVYPSGDIKVYDYSAIIHKTGDGNKFLSDDGNYKEISVPTKLSQLDNDSGYGLAPYIWNGITNETIFNELKTAIEADRDIMVNDKNISSVLLKVNHAIVMDEAALLYITFANENTIYRINKNDVTRVYYPSNQMNYSSNTPCTSGQYNTYSINRDFTIDFDKLDENLNFIPNYQGEFSFGDTVYDVTFPNDVKWSTDSVLDYKANHTYQFKIVNNLGVMKEFANA